MDGRVDYVMYQDGEAYLSVNDQLYPASSLDTVADSEYYEGVALAKTVTDMVGQLPDLQYLTTAWEKAVTQLREIYEDFNFFLYSKLVDAREIIIESLHPYHCHLAL